MWERFCKGVKNNFRTALLPSYTGQIQGRINGHRLKSSKDFFLSLTSKWSLGENRNFYKHKRNKNRLKKPLVSGNKGNPQGSGESVNVLNLLLPEKYRMCISGVNETF